MSTKNVYFYWEGEYNDRINDNIAWFKSQGFNVYGQHDLPYHKRLLENDKAYQRVISEGKITFAADIYLTYLLSIESGFYLEIHKHINKETFMDYYQKVKTKELAVIKETASVILIGVIWANGKLARKCFKSAYLARQRGEIEYLNGQCVEEHTLIGPMMVTYGINKVINLARLLSMKKFETKKILISPLNEFLDFTGENWYYSVVGWGSWKPERQDKTKKNYWETLYEEQWKNHQTYEQWIKIYHKVILYIVCELNRMFNIFDYVSFQKFLFLLTVDHSLHIRILNLKFDK